MPGSPKKHHWFTRFIRIIIISFIAAVLFALTLYMAIAYRPGHYNPQPLSPIQHKTANDTINHLVANTHNHLAAAQAFTFTIEQQTANKILLMDTTEDKFLENLQKSFLNTELSEIIIEPQIAFVKDTILIMGRYEIERYNTTQTVVLTLSLQPQLSANNQTINFNIVSIKLGAIAVNDHIIQQAIARLKQSQRQKVIQIIKDKKFNIENRFKAQDNLFSIQAIKINNSSIAIDFIPILKT